MPYYYYFILMIAVLIIIYLVRSGTFSTKSTPLELFNEALREENSGDFQAAFMNYELALSEAGKNKFHSNLKNRIQEKLKVLHTIIEYEKSMHLAKRISK